jgi:hypothetical protein
LGRPEPRALVRRIGFVLLGLVLYVTLTATVFTASFILLRERRVPHLPWISAVQEHIYYAGARRIWSAQPDCAQFDDVLVYVPRIGSCHFDNPEFSTLERFSEDGRYTGPRRPGIGIAVVGDSHAMGWGVNDEETFSAELQRLSGRPVYNLAVASYGTARELIRLDRSGILDRVDTLIIQYCENDLDENINFKPKSLEETRKKFDSIGQAVEGRMRAFGSLAFVNSGFWFTFTAPITGLRQAVFPRKPYDFNDHYGPFIALLRKYPSLSNKRVLVVYSNAHGDKFRNYPVGRDQQLPYVEFIDLDLRREDYYQLDDHPVSEGHRKIGRQLFDVLRQAAKSRQ